MLPSRMSRLVVYEVLLISTTRNVLFASQVEGGGCPWQRPFIRVRVVQHEFDALLPSEHEPTNRPFSAEAEATPTNPAGGLHPQANG